MYGARAFRRGDIVIWETMFFGGVHGMALGP
jgi:hypothetical protein